MVFVRVRGHSDSLHDNLPKVQKPGDDGSNPTDDRRRPKTLYQEIRYPRQIPEDKHNHKE